MYSGVGDSDSISLVNPQKENNQQCKLKTDLVIAYLKLLPVWVFSTVDAEGFKIFLAQLIQGEDKSVD